MPVLMNKGVDPRQASWLFFTDRPELEAFAQIAVERRFDAGRLVVDDADLDAARKTSAEVPVYLQVDTLVPEDFDITELGARFSSDKRLDEVDDEDLAQAKRAALEAAKAAKPGAAEKPDDAAGDQDTSDASPWDEEAASELPYEPVAAPEGLRIPFGRTTAGNARTYLRPEPGDGGAWDAKLPGLQVLASIVAFTGEHGGTPAVAVWRLDGAGVLRMSPAKQAKPMAGNILSCKL